MLQNLFRFLLKTKDVNFYLPPLTIRKQRTSIDNFHYQRFKNERCRLIISTTKDLKTTDIDWQFPLPKIQKPKASINNFHHQRLKNEVCRLTTSTTKSSKTKDVDRQPPQPMIQKQNTSIDNFHNQWFKNKRHRSTTSTINDSKTKKSNWRFLLPNPRKRKISIIEVLVSNVSRRKKVKRQNQVLDLFERGTRDFDRRCFFFPLVSEFLSRFTCVLFFKTITRETRRAPINVPFPDSARGRLTSWSFSTGRFHGWRSRDALSRQSGDYGFTRCCCETGPRVSAIESTIEEKTVPNFCAFVRRLLRLVEANPRVTRECPFPWTFYQNLLNSLLKYHYYERQI